MKVTPNAFNRVLDEEALRNHITAIGGRNLGQILDDAKINFGKMMQTPDMMLFEGRGQGELPEDAKKKFVEGWWKFLVGSTLGSERVF